MADTRRLDADLDAFVDAAHAAQAFVMSEASGVSPSGWDLQIILAHVAANERLIAFSIAEQLGGGRAGYRNDAVLDERLLRAVVRASDGFDDLLGQVRSGARELVEMLDTYADRLAEPIHVHIRDGESVIVDEPWTVERLLTGNFSAHLRLHRRQLEELASVR